LAEVCRSEDLPAPGELSEGERRVVEETGCAPFVAQLARAQIVPRAGRRTEQAAATVPQRMRKESKPRKTG
jgi:hypothetical protein